MITETTLDSLSLKLTDALLSSNWEHWLSEVAAVFEAPKVFLVPHRSDPHRPPAGATVGLTQDQRSTYASYYGQIDVIWYRLLHAQSMKGFSTGMLVPDDEYLQSEIFNDFMRPSGIRYILTTSIDVDAAHRFLFGCSRSEDDNDFTRKEIDAIERLAQHVRQALRLECLLGETGSQLSAAHWTLEQLAVPTLLLTNGLKVLLANEAAVELLRSGDVVGNRQGRLIASERTSARRLDEAVGLVASGTRTQMLVSLCSQTSAGRVSAIVIRTPTEHPRFVGLGVPEPEILVFLLPHVPKGAPPPEYLMTGFGFTPKEASTASLLAGGADLAEIARSLGVSREGVRHHLKRLFWKTGTHSQQELVRVLANVIASLKCWDGHPADG